MPQTFNIGARSPIVSAIGWLAIGFAALATASALASPFGLGAALTALRPIAARAPQLSAWLAGHLPWLLGGLGVLAVAVLVSAVGLLRRREWARRVFIALLALTVAGHVAGIWLQHQIVHGLFESALRQVPLPASAAGVFGGFALAAQGMGLLVTLGGCALLVWVIVRLMSDGVRQEFA